MKKGLKYTVYLSGWVCAGDKYLFRIDDEEILAYVMDHRWHKKSLDSMLDNYPEAFYNEISERKRSNDAANPLA